MCSNKDPVQPKIKRKKILKNKRRGNLATFGKYIIALRTEPETEQGSGNLY